MEDDKKKMNAVISLIVEAYAKKHSKLWGEVQKISNGERNPNQKEIAEAWMDLCRSYAGPYKYFGLSPEEFVSLVHAKEEEKKLPKKKEDPNQTKLYPEDKEPVTNKRTLTGSHQEGVRIQTGFYMSPQRKKYNKIKRATKKIKEKNKTKPPNQ